jgi:tetrahydromethanopterin S-methyltransferase subunit E
METTYGVALKRSVSSRIVGFCFVIVSYIKQRMSDSPVPLALLFVMERVEVREKNGQHWFHRS